VRRLDGAAEIASAKSPATRAADRLGEAISAVPQVPP